MEHILKINHTVTPTDKVGSGIRIINIGDMHYGKKTKVHKIMRVFQLIEKLKPDYICWLGDNVDTTNLMDSGNKSDEFKSFLLYSGAIAPTMVSLADHDQRYCFSDGSSKVDFREFFWNSISKMPNVHLLHNSSYEDRRVCFVGYTLPSYYYASKYQLPAYSQCSSERLDEDVNVLIEDMDIHHQLFERANNDKYNAVLFHSPQHIDNKSVAYHLRCFDHIFSGHMHEGCMPPILDDIIPGDRGIISPQRKLFPGKSRGIIETPYGNLCIINGGLTKIHGSASKVLRPFNCLFPMHLDIVDVVPNEQAGVQKVYTRDSYYKYIK